MMVPKYEGYSFESDELLRYKRRIYVPPNDELGSLIFSESYRSSSVHGSSGSHKNEGRP
jgi:hypothetical protein